MTAAPPYNFLTPRNSSLTLRGADDPSQQQSVGHGESLMVVSRMQGGFVEVEYRGRRWLASESALEPLRGGLGAPPIIPATPPAGGVAFGQPAGGAAARGSRFPVAVVVGRVLVGLGFLVLGLGIFFGLIFALVAPGIPSIPGYESAAAAGSGVLRVMLFIFPILFGCIYSLPLLAGGYVLLLLDAMELNTRT